MSYKATNSWSTALSASLRYGQSLRACSRASMTSGWPKLLCRNRANFPTAVNDSFISLADPMNHSACRVNALGREHRHCDVAEILTDPGRPYPTWRYSNDPAAAKIRCGICAQIRLTIVNFQSLIAVRVTFDGKVQYVNDSDTEAQWFLNASRL
jgi:hypothetical protein